MGLINRFLEELRNKVIAVSVFDLISSDDPVMLVIDDTVIPCPIEVFQDQEYMDIFARFLYEDESDQEGELCSKESSTNMYTIIAANALYEAGIPFEIYGLDKIFDRIEGKDYISVAPISESAFFGDCIHLPKGKAGALVAKETIWEFDKYQRKKQL